MTEAQQARLVDKTIQFVKDTLHDAEGGHDWFHVQRVFNLSKYIRSVEGGNKLIIQLGALLHDIADAKFYEGDELLGIQRAREFLESEKVSDHVIQEVLFIIKHISFRSSLGKDAAQIPSSKELRILQDADRLDAIGAIGIARTFNYGGFRNRKLYDPAIPYQEHQTKETYIKSQAPTINHFYEKLLRLKDLMHTTTGKKLAQERHDYMQEFLRQFYEEWNFNSI